ncbi:hypothetical protein NUKP64_15920 [Klebsiella variicola]|nr:hypothetical protein NUKP64_15920 [Klebsiella variicola]
MPETSQSRILGLLKPVHTESALTCSVHRFTGGLNNICDFIVRLENCSDALRVVNVRFGTEQTLTPTASGSF